MPYPPQGVAVDASRITSGTLDLARIPDLPASKLTSGSLALARIPNTLTGKDADSVDGRNPGSASGLATLDANSKVVQDPTSYFIADIFDKVRLFIPWISLDGFDLTVDTGGDAEARGVELYLNTHSDVDDKAYIVSKHPFKANYFLLPGKLVSVEFIVTDWSSFQNIEACLFLSSDSSPPPPTETLSHFGFKLEALDIYASNADGSTQKKTDIGDLGLGDQRVRLRVVMNYGTDCKFYIDDVLKRTETANLPSAAADYYIIIGVKTGATSSKHMHLERLLIEKEN